jgi:formylglycine-generating enzyme required for sulfatase activity
MIRPACPQTIMSRTIPAAWAIVLSAIALVPGCTAPAEQDASDMPAVPTASGEEMVSLPGGWFEMGSADEEETDQKLHRVYVSPFLIDRHPVTQEQFGRLMGSNPSIWKSPSNPVDHIRWSNAAAFCNARSRLEGLQPAYDPVTWECRFEADGYRLPTEAEFEYALRAGTTTPYFFGNHAAELKHYAWFKGNSTGGSHPVGQKRPNPWGLHDMIGNVWQWCNDYYQEDYYPQSPERDPHGPASGENRVVRGGCWNSKPGDCRSAYRNLEMPAFTDICFGKDIHGQIGFRCVRRVPEN